MFVYIAHFRKRWERFVAEIHTGKMYHFIKCADGLQNFPSNTVFTTITVFRAECCQLRLDWR